MQVILKGVVKNLGQAGDLVTVSDGYARNFLIAKGLAEEATHGKLSEWKQKQKSIKAKENKQKQSAEATAALLKHKTIIIRTTTGENGRLFGSVTTAQIAQSLEDEHSVKVDKRDIKLSEPIKQVGRYPFLLKLYGGIQTEMTLLVVDINE